MAETKWFKFGRGLAQRTDDRLLEPGVPRAVENLVQIKDGRLEMRKDFDALVVTTQPATTLTLFDLHESTGRLLGVGMVDGSFAAGDLSPTKSPIDVVEYVGEPLFGWRATNGAGRSQVSLATELRDMATVIVPGGTIDTADVAAGSGRVCVVWVSPNGRTDVHIFDADSDSTILTASIAGMTFPRVVCIGAIFYISGVIADAIVLRRYDPAVDTALTSLPDPAAATTAILCYDMTLAHEGTTFWIVAGRAAGFRIHGFNSAGTETHDFNGAVTVADFIGILTEAVNGGVQRVHVCTVTTATGVVNMHTYTASTSTLQTATLNIFATTAISQPSMAVKGLGAATGAIAVAFQTGANIMTHGFIDSTHALDGSLKASWSNAIISSKLTRVRDHLFIASRIQEGADGTSTNVMLFVSRNTANARPCTAVDRLIAGDAQIGRLPNIATDATTGRSYWAKFRDQLDVTGQPMVTELIFCSTSRRQTAQVGSVLYMAGGFVGAYDGRLITEASFLTRPRLLTLVESDTVGGALTLLGTYQVVFVYEVTDCLGNRIQSAPSDVTEITLTGTNDTLTATVVGSHSNHNDSFASIFSEMVKIVCYRTLNTAGGNLTFHRDEVCFESPSGTGVTHTFGTFNALINSDVVLSENEILYTQGARGALSGPLPFDPPQGCVSLAASADRILSGGLPDSSAIQESRVHLESEQINWSNSIGFRRDARGRILAVARLDERRIIFTATEIFEMDGPGLDDNGNGDIGAPRRLPSDVGLFGGALGWRSMVECSIGILFQGLQSLIYLLPRGGSTPLPIGLAVQTQLAAFPTITAAVYLPEDQTVRFTCNNLAATDAISLLYDVVEDQWFVEGPYGTTVTAATKFGGRMCLLRNNVVFQQRATHPPATFINNAWRSGTVHPFGPEQWGRVYAFHFYGEYRGDCQLACVVRYDDLVTETLTPVGVGGLTVGDPYSHKFVTNQCKCESFRVDFQVTLPALQIVTSSSQAFAAASTRFNVTLPATRQIGDRIVIGISVQASAGTNAVATPEGWRAIQTGAFSGFLRVNIYDRTLDGTEQDSVVFVATESAAALTKLWLIRGQHSTQLTESVQGTNASPTATTLDIGNLAPTWGNAANLWLIFMGIASENTPPQITVYPTGFINTGELQNVSGTALLDGTIGFCDQILTAASLNPTAFTYTRDGIADSRSIGYILAIRPAVASEGLAYQHWGYDADPAGKSALKGPSQMS